MTAKVSIPSRKVYYFCRDRVAFSIAAVCVFCCVSYFWKKPGAFAAIYSRVISSPLTGGRMVTGTPEASLIAFANACTNSLSGPLTKTPAPLPPIIDPHPEPGHSISGFEDFQPKTECSSSLNVRQNSLASSSPKNEKSDNFIFLNNFNLLKGSASIMCLEDANPSIMRISSLASFTSLLTASASRFAPSTSLLAMSAVVFAESTSPFYASGCFQRARCYPARFTSSDSGCYGFHASGIC